MMEHACFVAGARVFAESCGTRVQNNGSYCTMRCVSDENGGEVNTKTNVSRRVFVKGAVVGGCGLVVSGVIGGGEGAWAGELKKMEELKKDMESLKYEEELLLNPDPEEKLSVNVKPPVKEPAYVKIEEDTLAKEKAKYSKMLEDEKESTTQLLKKFKK
mmetsp:Transcript_1652/g.3517  ORF Transcript_1652/g.3517 Transcript_1652/m.3517 type:complete len:159 (-) Transcript_1652:622-1098(-)